MDVALTPEQEELVATVTALLSKESTAERVRAAEPLGFDDDLWRKLLPLELVAMALPESAGGYGGKFEDLVLVTEQLGRRLAPVPLIETIVTARVAAAAVEAGQGIVARALERDARPLATALRPAQEGRAVLVPAGAVAPLVVGLDGDDLVAVESEPPLDAPPNLGCLPLADRDLRTEPRAVLASGADARALHERAVQEWKLLTAAALVGLSAEALDMGVEYAKGRVQFNVPIGSFQAVAHRLADAHTATEGARLLVYEAAWAADEGLAEAAALASMAFVFAAESAQRTSTWSLHFHGGYGFMLEYDIQLFFRRAKAWALAYDSTAREYQRVADLLYGPAGR